MTENLKSLTCLHEAILADAGMVCSTSIDRDLKTLRSRVKHEGLSFLTITLPNFAKSIFGCIERGKATPRDFMGFKTPKGRCLPAFLQGFTGLVFNVKKGELLDTPNIDAVDALRQVCLAFSKIRFECTRKRNKAAEAAYILCESELSRFRWTDYCDNGRYGRVADSLYGMVFRELESQIRAADLMPRHGPGSTEDRTLGNEKYKYLKWTQRLQRYFPVDRYLFSGYSELEERALTSGRGECNLNVEFLSKEPHVRVVFVPKTLKSPRVIAIEPVHTQYVQQAIMRKLVRYLQSSRSKSKGHVNFDDQSINGTMARINSLSREYSTLDLSEASDRVHSLFAHHLLERWPVLRRAIFSCRSKYAKLPSGQVAPLKKFASMGSALCFPVESMVFNTIVITALLRHRGLSNSCQNVRSVQKDVYVFGDDIIVPSREVDIVKEALHSAGLLVNENKTFTRSHFRESCGTDAYMGVVITPVYIREDAPLSRRDASRVLSWISTANLFYKKGYWKTAKYLRQYVEDILGVVPHVLEERESVGWYSFLGTYSVDRWNKDLHRFDVRGYVPVIRKDSDHLDEYRALLKYHLMRGEEPLTSDSFSKRVRSGSLHIKNRWVAAA